MNVGARARLIVEPLRHLSDLMTDPQDHLGCGVGAAFRPEGIDESIHSIAKPPLSFKAGFWQQEAATNSCHTCTDWSLSLRLQLSW